MRVVKEKIVAFVFYIMRIFPIKKDKIVVSSYLGQGYGDNGKYIVEQLLKQEKHYDIVWLLRDSNNGFPEGVRSVRYLSIRSVYEQATAKVWIANRRKPDYVRKRKGQFYLATWHGGLALKRIEKDAQEALPSHYIKAAKRDSRMVDLFLSNSSWLTEKYRQSFWYNGQIAEIGLPREDVFYKVSADSVSRIKTQLGVPEGKQILLYAPTFRKTMDEASLGVYQIDWKRLLESCRNRFGGGWIGMVRLHPNLAAIQDRLALPSTVRNVSTYPDMQELLLAADVLITDYSSSMFEYSYTDRPVFLYTPDLDAYMADRNFYFNLRDLPFPLAENEEALTHSIQHFDLDAYHKALRYFLRQLGIVPGGDASRRAADIIRRAIEE